MSRSRWWAYSVEVARGQSGPWGPIEAETQVDAERIAAARLARDGLTLARVEPVDQEQQNGGSA